MYSMVSPGSGVGDGSGTGEGVGVGDGMGVGDGVGVGGIGVGIGVGNGRRPQSNSFRKLMSIVSFCEILGFPERLMELAITQPAILLFPSSDSAA